MSNYAAPPSEVEVEARADAALIKALMRRTAEDIITAHAFEPSSRH